MCASRSCLLRVITVMEKKLKETVRYMVEAVKRDLMIRYFRKPNLTAEVYRNASKTMPQTMPDFYGKVSVVTS